MRACVTEDDMVPGAVFETRIGKEKRLVRVTNEPKKFWRTYFINDHVYRWKVIPVNGGRSMWRQIADLYWPAAI